MSGLAEHFEQNGCEAYFSNVRTADNYICALGATGAIAAMDTLNQVVLQEDPARSTVRGRGMLYLDRRSEDEDFVDIVSGDVLYVPPSAVYSTELLTEAYETAKGVWDTRDRGELAYLASFLTHRYENGNTRVGATIKSLWRNGYDGSSAMKAYYSTLETGLEGVQRLGLNLDTTFLQQRYGQMATERALAGHRYTASAPEGVSSVTLYDAHSLQTALPIELITDNALLLAERFTNLPLGLSYLLATRRSLPNYLEPDGKGGKQLSVEAIFSDMTEGDAETLRELNDPMKVEFIRSVIAAFQTEDNIYGMPYQELVERLRPTASDTSEPAAQVNNG